MTDLIRALTAGVSESAVPWKYQRTIPPFVKIVNKSNIFLHYSKSRNLLYRINFLSPLSYL